MAYLRWSGSDWYVFAHCDGGLAVWSRFDDESAHPIYTDAQVRAFLSGAARLDAIPGWRETSTSERQELLWSMREYVADDANENLYAIGDSHTPTIRQILRESAEKDIDGDAFTAHVEETPKPSERGGEGER